RRFPPPGFARPFRRPAPPLRGRGDDDRGLRDHADRAAGRRAHHADEPRPPERRRRGHGGVRRHRRVSDPRVPLPATAATRRGYNPGARPGARGAVRTRRNAIGILLGIELMLNAVNINLVAFARFHGDLLGLVFTLFTIAITVAEVALGLAIVIVIFRVRRTVEADRLDLLRG